MTNIAHLRNSANLQVVIGSIHERPILAEHVDNADVIFHLAAAVGVRLVVDDPVKTIETNVHGTELLL